MDEITDEEAELTRITQTREAQRSLAFADIDAAEEWLRRVSDTGTVAQVRALLAVAHALLAR